MFKQMVHVLLLTHENSLDFGSDGARGGGGGMTVRCLWSGTDETQLRRQWDEIQLRRFHVS